MKSIQPMTPIQIDIVSDIACPWCAIGLARLEQAMAQLPDYEFNLQWLAFELRPEQSGQGQPILPALAKKYGRSEAEMRDNQAKMQAIASTLGINFDLIQQRLTCNTFDGHRLVKWADDQHKQQNKQQHKQQQKQTALKKALFSVYFGEAQNIADHEVLLACVEAVGLDKAAAKAVLASEQYGAAVREDEARAQAAGISSVPAFIINGQYLISGAQEPAALVSALKEIGEQADGKS